MKLDQAEIRERLSKVKLLILDCDGVLTDGRLYFGASGEELKVFHARDGQGLVDWHKAGGRTAIISGRNSPIVETRAKQLGIEFVFQGISDKVAKFHELLTLSGVEPDASAFVGDDIPDAEVFPLVSVSVAVADAHPRVLEAAGLVTSANGGRGAVREVTDLLLESHS